jgi:hypothetical protein
MWFHKDVHKLGEAGNIRQLIRALNYENYNDRYLAAQYLGNLKSKEAVKPLLATLNDDQWGVRRESAIALGKIGDNEVISPLLSYCKKEGNIEVKKEIANTLNKLGWKPLNDRENVKYLIAAQDWYKLGELYTQNPDIINHFTIAKFYDLLAYRRWDNKIDSIPDLINLLVKIGEPARKALIRKIIGSNPEGNIVVEINPKKGGIVRGKEFSDVFWEGMIKYPSLDHDTMILKAIYNSINLYREALWEENIGELLVSQLVPYISHSNPRLIRYRAIAAVTIIMNSELLTSEGNLLEQTTIPFILQAFNDPDKKIRTFIMVSTVESIRITIYENSYRNRKQSILTLIDAIEKEWPEVAKELKSMLPKE